MSDRNEPAWVFLSYSSKNRTIAERLEQDLEQRHIRTWRDEHNIPIGGDWEDDIRVAISQSSVVLYLASPDARTSKVVRGELNVAKAAGKLIFPVWVEGGVKWADVAPLDHIIKHYIDIRGSEYSRRLDQLAEELSPRKLAERYKTLSRMPASPINGGTQTEPSSQSDKANEPGKTDKKAQGTTSMNQHTNPNNFSIKRLWHSLQTILLSLVSQPPAKGDESETVELQGPRNPYKGLKAFTTNEKDDFFGRDTFIDRMTNEIKYILQIEQEDDHRQEPRFLAIVGPSGSGKSSVIMAGLIPGLQQGKSIAGSDQWIFLPPMRPGKNPLETLAQTLLAQLPAGNHIQDVLAHLSDDSTRWLHNYAGEIARKPKERVVLVIDQFEELFTETTDEAQRQQFVDLLTIAATEPQNKVFVLVTLRADFSNFAMKHHDFYRLIEAHRIPIPPLTIEELREVIIRPTQLPDVQVDFEENLVVDLLLDIRGQEENLPLLQFTLNKLFEERDRDNNRLTADVYKAIGGVRGALGKHAEDKFAQLSSDEHRDLARTLFTRLVNPGGLDQDATRRRVPKSEFDYSNPAQRSQMQAVIDHFIAARLITADEMATVRTATHTTRRVPIIEISHEALISAWTRLTDWIKIERDDMLIQQALNNDIRQWQEQEKPQDHLYSGHHLARVEALAQRIPLNVAEEEFLRASKKQQQRQRAKIRIVAIVCLLVLVGIPGGIWFYTANRPALTQVTTLAGSGPNSLSQVIQDAPSGSTITFTPSLQGTIYLTNSDLDINKDLTIIGPTGSQKQRPQITLSNAKGKYDYRVHIYVNTIVTLENLRFSDSIVHQSTFLDNEGDLTLSNCMIDHNTSFYNGGGITNDDGSLTLINSTVDHNRSFGTGGGLYTWQGTLKLINSIVDDNSTSDNGGGIYATSAGVTLSNSQVTNNQTTSDDQTSYGGGICALNSMLLLDTGTKIASNKTYGYGGGIALLGSNSFMRKTIITSNSAGQKGGGLAVEINSENQTPSLVEVTDMAITAKPQGSYWIGNNHAPTARDILGKLPASSTSEPPGTTSKQSEPGEPVVIGEDTSEITGSPAPLRPPEKSPQYLGTVDLDTYCHASHPGKTVSLVFTTSEHMYCDILSGGQAIRQTINTQQACHWQYPNKQNVIDRLADYYDPSSWQCYAPEHRIGSGSITPYLNSFCQYEHYQGIAPIHENAYEWQCLDKNNTPVSIGMADACQWHYNNPDALDRLTDFNNPNGWECWAPA